MKSFKFSLIASLIFLVSLVAHAELNPDFTRGSLAREGRAPLVETAIDQNLISESKDGYLKPIGSPSSLVEQLIATENETRKNLFSIIASTSNRIESAVAREFAQRNGFDRFAGADTILRIHGSNTIGASLMPALVKDFLSQGAKPATGLTVRRDGVTSRIYFKSDGNDPKFSVVEIIAHGSSTAFDETEASKSVGLRQGFCEIGMASRPVKDKEAQSLMDAGLPDIRDSEYESPIAVDGVAIIVNKELPINELSVLDVARLFSGEISNWNSVGGPDQEVTLFSRDDQSGTFDTFKSKVLKPTKRPLSSTVAGRFEQNSEIVAQVSETPGAIGFVGLSSLEKSVKALSIRAADDTRAFFPNRLTLKSLDYPLSRLLYIYTTTSGNDFSNDLVDFIMSDAGQTRVDQEGLIGQGMATSLDREQAIELKESLIADESIPGEYRLAIAKASREDTSFNVRFEKGQSALDANSVNNLDRLVDRLANPEFDGASVVLIGFTDSAGSASGNVTLSRQRAETVASLLRSKGVSAVEIHGLGEVLPVGDNSTNDGQAANRRVEVWLRKAQ